LKPLIAITLGDFNGIGPEIALTSLIQPSILKICKPVLIGSLDVFNFTAHHLKLKIKLEKASISSIPGSVCPVLDVGDGIGPDIQYGIPTKSSGRSAGIAIEHAVELCTQNKVAAMVTGPVSKEALHLAGYNFPGQTEMIALLSHSQKVAMILVAETMRIGLVTIHTAIRAVAQQLSKEKVLEKIGIIHESLKKDFLVKKPRLAILALNPHAGEKGILGTEEDELITPAITESRAMGINAEGPFSADAFFGNHRYKDFDGLVAMYHDQGLIPLKMNSFGKGVNFSAGLGLIRTSPDHGTAYDIAGKHKANNSSMIEAIKLAVRISKNRHAHD
jgi:4-hydroxythreonine-4-phosphate dehydrogenase